MAFDPKLRLTASQALEHPWLVSYHDVDDEPTCSHKFDRWKYLEEIDTLEKYREALLKEIQDCRREVRSTSSHRDLSPPRTPGTAVHTIEEETGEEEHLTPMPFPSTESPSRPGSPESLRRHERERSVAKAIAEAQATPILSQTDPVVAYARRTSMFVHSRTNSTYSVHRVPSAVSGLPGGTDSGGNTVAFPTASQDFVRPSRSRTTSTIGYQTEDRRRLLRTLSTVSIYETGEGRAGGLASIAPIAKYIVEKDRSGDDELQSEMPRELGEGDGEDQGSFDEKLEMPADGSGDRKRRFTIE